MKSTLAALALVAALPFPTSALAMDPSLGWTTNDERAALMYAANTFGALQCKFETDDAALLMAFKRMGYTHKDVSAEKGDTIQLWISRFLRDQPGACASIMGSFGPTGTLMPNLVKAH